VRLDLLDEHLRIIKKHQVATLSIPVMNWVTDTEESAMIDVANADVVLVDGTYTSLLTEVNIKIFITTSCAQTKQNRINRNREPVTDFIERVVAKESSIIQPHAVLADIWVDDNLQVLLPKKG
jgi:uridine kinase